MGLLVRAAERRGIMKGIGAGQQVSGNHVNEIAHEGHVGPVPQGVGEQDLPLLKGPAPVAFLSPRARSERSASWKYRQASPCAHPGRLRVLVYTRSSRPSRRYRSCRSRGGLRLRQVAGDVLDAPRAARPPLL